MRSLRDFKPSCHWWVIFDHWQGALTYPPASKISPSTHCHFLWSSSDPWDELHRNSRSWSTFSRMEGAMTELPIAKALSWHSTQTSNSPSPSIFTSCIWLSMGGFRGISSPAISNAYISSQKTPQIRRSFLWPTRSEQIWSDLLGSTQNLVGIFLTSNGCNRAKFSNQIVTRMTNSEWIQLHPLGLNSKWIPSRIRPSPSTTNFA